MTARDALIFSTIDLLRRHGVAGTGIAAITDHSHVSRRSIYNTFPDGKTELVREATQVAGMFIGHQIDKALDKPTPQESLAEFVAQWKEVVAGGDFSAGCPIAAAGLARSSEPDIADAAGEAFTRWQTAIADSLRRHGIPGPTAMQLSNTVLAAVEGAVLMAVAQRSLTPLDDVRSQVEILIDHHLARATHQ
ncbi:putative TetR-family transcriptional regulator [Mycolicibacterium arabiense]|uniref:Putative TetR-family transcriptional regulator n=1 Tax=Mycolicibacterium arabiense TaxID=1286181 RepID=A0A7I7RSV0_9MYCO|nr:TetR/AcrR family transcriptional regulator [Mycolicibacterium arabiense]MCV7375723.1 TetR/AcrR family transcriptional regulator [Mycolicibacterium arabiense]BBY47617.1 putative TetR-family transcriptional regulator [Mycolicibacterium arabiense]